MEFSIGGVRHSVSRVSRRDAFDSKNEREKSKFERHRRDRDGARPRDERSEPKRFTLLRSLLLLQPAVLGVNLHLEAHQIRRPLVKVESRILRVYPPAVPPTVTESRRYKENGKCRQI